MKRVCVYVDGFNLHHAILRLGNPAYHWFDLKKLVRHFIDPNHHDIKKIYFFTAYAAWMGDAHTRHVAHVNVLKAQGVNIVLGHFKRKDRSCSACHHAWKGHEEKETDVNIAIRMIDDAYQDRFDEAFLLSRDSDLVPAVRLLHERFPGKTIKIIAPPEAGHSKEMAKLVGSKNLKTLRRFHFDHAVLPNPFVDQYGRVISSPINR